MVLGLAGSACLMILVLSTIHSAAAGLVYIAVFGLGSLGGMLVMSSLISMPFVWTPRRFTLLTKGLQFTVGLASMAFGFVLVWQLSLYQIPTSLHHNEPTPSQQTKLTS